MLRWRLSTVRTFGGHDSHSRLSSHLRVSEFSCRRVDVTVTIAGLARRPESKVIASPPGQFCPTNLPDVAHLPLGEGHHRWRDTTGRSAIDALMQFLSTENISSNEPLIYSPTAIRSLFYRAESTNQLGMLDFKRLTFLIGLFGSLSVDLRVPIVYRIPLASHLFQVSTRRTHWGFILKVGRYKRERGMTLQDSDRFWLMRAELASAQAKSRLEPASNDTYRAILRARTHYRIIRRHSSCSEVHAYYLASLLDFGDPRLLEIAACDLSFLLRVHCVYRPWLQRLLYRLVVQNGPSLSSRSQEAVLTALWHRISQGIEGITDIVPEHTLSNIALDDYINSAATLAQSLSATLFGLIGHLSANGSVNSIGRLFSVFSPVYALPLRWSSLVSFCIFNSSGMSYFKGIHWINDLAMPQVTSCWRVIFGLATIEKTLQYSSASAMQPASKVEVLDTTRTLCMLWLPIVKSRSVSRDLACVVATSFFGVAGVLADATLFHDCRDLYLVENSSEGTRVMAQRLFTARYIVAAVRVQGPFPDVVLVALKSFSLDSKQQYQVLGSVVEALAPIDVSLAYRVYIAAQGKAMEPDSRAAHTLAMSFARHGALHQATLFLDDHRFSIEQRGTLVSAIAGNLRENPRAHPSSVLVAIVEELAALYHSHVPPQHFRGHLEQLVVSLARHGRGRQLLPVVLSIFSKSASYFQSHFFARYCHVLVQHRQFVTASKLLNAISTEHPKIARFIHTLISRVALRTKAFRIFRRIAPLRVPASLKISSRLRRWTHEGPPLERSLQELLRSGRLLAAKRMFVRAVPALPSRHRTTLGNILLHGMSHQPTPRNGRRVRKVFALLEDLVEHHGFRPDRVTANILIKAMISWRSAFDSPRLRELFDQLIRGGYPAADYSSSHPPFGTRRTQFISLSGIPKLPSLISFEKHARPLFKMFIKAFYLCNDVEAARKVVGILKVEEYKHIMIKGTRQRARRRGRMKAAQRNVMPLDATVP